MAEWMADMKVVEISAWLAGLISSDGHVRTSGRSINISIATTEENWANQIVKILQTHTDLKIIRHGPYTHGLMTITITPTWRAYEILKPAKELMMERKWRPLEEYFEPFLTQNRPRLQAYKEVTELIRQGEVPHQACKIIASKFTIPEHTIQFWVYNKQKPRMYREKV